METTVKLSSKKSLLITSLLLVLTASASAQTSTNFLSKFYNDITQGEHQASFFIIAGVFGFGLIAFLASKLVSKYSKEEPQTTNRPVSHRHHHHRVIKKSA